MQLLFVFATVNLYTKMHEICEPYYKQFSLKKTEKRNKTGISAFMNFVGNYECVIRENKVI